MDHTTDTQRLYDSLLWTLWRGIGATAPHRDLLYVGRIDLAISVLVCSLPHLRQGVESCSKKSRLGLSIFLFLLSAEYETVGIRGPIQLTLLDVDQQYLLRGGEALTDASLVIVLTAISPLRLLKIERLLSYWYVIH